MIYQNNLRKILIFDFDGTIADTFPHVMKIGNNLAEKYNFQKIESSSIEKYKDYTIKQILQKFNLPLWKLPLFAREVKRRLNKVITDVEPFPGIIDVLTNLHESGHRLMILTSNDQENVEIFLKKHKLEMFEKVHAGSSLFGKSRHINKIIKKNELYKETVLYIGDEVRDIEAARKSKILSIAVTWGYNAKNILEKHKPTIVVDNPKELLSSISKL